MGNDSILRTPSQGNMYRMFLLERNGTAVMQDLKDSKEREMYQLRCNSGVEILSHLGNQAKAMAIFDAKGVLVFGKLDPSVEKTFASWMKIS